MNKRAMGVVTAVVLLIMGYVVYGSMARVEKRCEVCVEFGGGRRCAKAAGANEKEAREAAQTTACGVLASGMDETIRCHNAQPVSVTCTG